MRMAVTPDKMAAASARAMAGATLGAMRLRISPEPEGEKGGAPRFANSEELEGSLLPFIVLRPTTLVMLRLWASLLP